MDNPVHAAYDPRLFKTLTFYDAVPSFLDGKDTPRAYLERCIDTIEAREPQVEAFVSMNLEGARKGADASTRRYRAKRLLSQIDGMPIGIKDLYETVDMPTQMGSPIFKDWHSHRDSAAVHALRQGGALIIGKTVTTEFGFYSPGPTRNPFDSSRTPGGSSSGSAAAVGARMVPVSISGQVVGSTIRPASFCGVVGFKPTLGALNKAGGGNLSQSCLCVLAGCLEDMWNVSHHIAEYAGGDPGYPGLFGKAALAPPRQPKRLARLETAGWAECNESVKATFEEVLVELERAGVEIVGKANDLRIAALEDALKEADEVTHDICGYELRWPLRTYRDRGANLLSDDLTARLKTWETLTSRQYRLALARREEMRKQHLAAKDGCEALITLAAPGAAPVGLNATGKPTFAVPASILGAPAIALPVLESEAMPLGIQLVGFPHDDADLAAIANWTLRTLVRNT